MVEGQDVGSADETNRHINRKMKSGQIPEWVPGTPLEKGSEFDIPGFGNRRGKQKAGPGAAALKLCPDSAGRLCLVG